MRGIPGSGKSAWVKHYLARQKEGAKVCSADFFFVHDDGVYRFDPKLLAKAHAWCMSQYIEALASTAHASPIVVVDNTNSQCWEFQNYIDIAQAWGYGEITRIVEMACPTLDDARAFAKRNIHGVPPETIGAMLMRWESVPVSMPLSARVPVEYIDPWYMTKVFSDQKT